MFQFLSKALMMLFLINSCFEIITFKAIRC